MATSRTSATDLVGALLTLGRMLDRRVEPALAGVGLTVESWRVLELVVRSPGRSMREISDRLALPAATATRTVDQLVAVGLAYRGVAAQDRRCVILHPTDQGRAVLRAARRAMSDVEGEARAALDRRGIDVAAVVEALDEVVRRA
jgi:DNA-binding MarR family transcriptional regulator